MATRNVKGVARRDKPTENVHPTVVPLSSPERFGIFWLIVFILQPTTVLNLYKETFSNSSNDNDRFRIIFLLNGKDAFSDFSHVSVNTARGILAVMLSGSNAPAA